jgi:hypothetical protein
MLASSTFPTAPQSHMIGQGPIPSTGRPTSAPALDRLLPGHGREIIVQHSPQSSTLPGIPQDAGFTRALFGEASPDDCRHPVRSASAPDIGLFKREGASSARGGWSPLIEPEDDSPSSGGSSARRSGAPSPTRNLHPNPPRPPLSSASSAERHFGASARGRGEESIPSPPRRSSAS